jgi:hypothetical protein
MALSSWLNTRDVRSKDACLLTYHASFLLAVSGAEEDQRAFHQCQSLTTFSFGFLLYRVICRGLIGWWLS